MPVADLLERMSACEFDDWQRFAAIESFGEERADLRMGILASVIANSNRDPNQRPQPFAPSDFIPHFDKAAEKPRSVGEQAADAAKRETDAERVYERKMAQLAETKA